MAMIHHPDDAQRARAWEEVKNAFGLSEGHGQFIREEDWDLSTSEIGGRLAVTMVVEMSRDEARNMHNRIVGGV